MDLLFVWLYDFYFLIKLLTLPLVERGSCLLLWPERCEDFGKTWKKSFPRNFPANCALPNYVPRIDTHEMENLCSIFCRTFCLRCLNFRWLWSIFGWPNRLRTTARDDLGLLWFALRLNGGPLDAAIYTAYVTAARSTIALPLSLASQSTLHGIGPPYRGPYSLSLRSASYRIGSGRAFPFFVLGAVATQREKISTIPWQVIKMHQDIYIFQLFLRLIILINKYP